MAVSRLVLLGLVALVSGHGRMVNPAGRSSAWRYGFKTSKNYDDDGLNCGGYGNQWERQGGKCGICGDPYQGPWPNEAGGKYATGTIVKTYKKGQIMDVEIELTTNNRGWQEFRLCPNNDVKKRAKQECFDQYLLVDLTGQTRLDIPWNKDWYDIQLKLPAGLTCSQCILQWRWHCGNSWGKDPVTGEEGMGKGPQEQFYACADIAII